MPIPDHLPLSSRHIEEEGWQRNEMHTSRSGGSKLVYEKGPYYLVFEPGSRDITIFTKDEVLDPSISERFRVKLPCGSGFHFRQICYWLAIPLQQPTGDEYVRPFAREAGRLPQPSNRLPDGA